MAHADMAEGVEHAFVAEDAVGEREFLDEVGQMSGTVWSSFSGSPSRCRGRVLANPQA